MVNAVSIFGAMVALATITAASPLRDHHGKPRGFRHRHRNGTFSGPHGTGSIILSTGVPVTSEALPVSTVLAAPETIRSPFTVTYTLGLGPSARAVTKTYTKTETIYPTVPAVSSSATPIPEAPVPSPSSEDKESEYSSDEESSDDEDSDDEDSDDEEEETPEEPCKAATTIYSSITVTEVVTVTATPSSVLASPSIAISSDVIPESVITPAPEAPSSQPTSAAHYTNATSEVDSTTTISTFITTYLGTGTGAAYPTGY